MNTAEITFVPIKPRRRHDSPNMKVWACVYNGKVLAYTDEPETLMAGLPRNLRIITPEHKLCTL